MDGKKKARLRLVLRLLLIATLCFIWGNSLVPGKESGDLSRRVFEWLVGHHVPIPSEHFLRKAAHFCEFAVVGIEYALLFWLRGGLRFQSLCNAAFASLLTAMTDETIQMFASERGSALKDVLLDFGGSLTGIALCALAVWLITRMTKTTDSRV